MGQIDGVDRRTDTVLLLLDYAAGVGSGRLQALVFLLERETAFSATHADAVGFDFEHGPGGPVSERVCEEVALLRQMDAVAVTPHEDASTTAADSSPTAAGDRLELTPKGRKIARQLVRALPARRDAELRGLVRAYDDPLDDLLAYVRRTYGPDVATGEATCGGTAGRGCGR